MLENAVALDPTFSAAWEKLGKRLEYEYTYDRGGTLAYERAQHAYERAFTLDHNLVSAKADLIRLQTENGDFKLALQEASELVNSRPEVAESHFAMSYVLRYGGELKRSAQECEAARMTDPSDYGLRTCAQTFIRLHDYARAADYINLDAGSNWAEGMKLQIYIRTGDRQTALSSVRLINGMSAPLVRACFSQKPIQEIQALSRAEENFPVRDPEARYHVAVVDAFCGLEDSAVRLLVAAANGNYCPAEDLTRDPLLARLNGVKSFEKVKQSTQECRSRFASSYGLRRQQTNIIGRPEETRH
jgi:tetratricopeptide (TPR) repeat protein